MAREILNSSVRVDWEGKTVRITPKWVALGIQFLSTLIPTLVIEGLVLIAFGLMTAITSSTGIRKSRKNSSIPNPPCASGNAT